MYTPSHFQSDDVPAMLALMQRHPFALLITPHAGQLHTSHLPFLLRSGPNQYGLLEAHLARANPHGEALRAGAASLVVFRGPDAYISPRWYLDPAANVPTWNYAAVHVHGQPRVIDDPQRTLEIIGRLTDAHEARFENPWSVEEARPHAERLVPHVLAFELEIERLEGKFKLSQNRLAGDRAGVIRALAAGNSSADREMLAMMTARYSDDGMPRSG